MLHGDNWNFIHIPKCGGMALRRHLSGYEFGEFMPLGSACAVRSVLHRIPRKRPSGRVCAVVRHPAAWLRSYWLDQHPRRVNANRYLHQYWSDDLNEFVENVCIDDPGYVSKLYSAHIRYHDVKVFRLEDGLDLVLKWAGAQGEVEIVNGSLSPAYLSAESSALVTRTEAAALHRFGYVT